jgi:Mn-dependent DtxR family transcriptional regulator
MTEEQEEALEEFNDMISTAFGIDVFTYNSEVTDEFWGVLEMVAENRPAYNTDIAKKLNLKESHVELIQYLLCNKDHAEYGTSPRGCWLTPKGEAVYKKLKELKAKFE